MASKKNTSLRRNILKTLRSVRRAPLKKRRVGKKTLTKPQSYILKTLRGISRAPLKKRRALLGSCAPSVIRCLAHICANALSGYIPLTKDQKRALAEHRDEIAHTAHLGGKRKTAQARKYMVQEGGFLPLLLGALSSLLPTVVQGVSKLFS